MKRVLLLLLLTISITLHAQDGIPLRMNYQGVLTSADGTVFPDGNVNITVTLYDSPSGGTALWTETQSVQVSAGIFDADLGLQVPIDLPFEQPYWIGLSINGGAELTPRTHCATTPYSFRSRVASLADRSTIADSAESISTKHNIGEVGIC